MNAPQDHIGGNPRGAMGVLRGLGQGRSGEFCAGVPPLGPRPSLCRAAQVGCDPATVKIRRMRPRVVFADKRSIDCPGINCDKIGDRRKIRGALGIAPPRPQPPAPGPEQVELPRPPLPFATGHDRHRVQQIRRKGFRRQVVAGCMMCLADPPGLIRLPDHRVADLQAQRLGHRLQQRWARIVLYVFKGRSGHGGELAPSLTASSSGATYSGYGVVAQLGERVVRNDEVRGSIPLGSTIYSPPISRISPITSSTPLPCRRLVNTKGRPARIRGRVMGQGVDIEGLWGFGVCFPPMRVCA